MPTEVKKEIRLEIAHVLFIDVVGYSKLLVDEQRSVIDELNSLVRETDEYREAESAGRLIKIPTGDGMALVFYSSPEAPVECALEISRALKEHPKLRVRMGVHSGPVSGVIDVNEHANVAGAGINFAQRVMDCGDGGHILLSKRVSEDLEHYGHWRPHLHDLGECEVKHGVRLSLVNLYTKELGNPTVPEKVRLAQAAAAKERKRTIRRWTSVGILALVAAALVIGFVVFRSKGTSLTGSAAIAGKSIAVLPFENLSRDPDNAFFADGVQDEILTDLARIADLKVISRTSVMQYKSGVVRNLRQIGQQLGVTHVLEGSVQRVANHVRVNAQLIDAQNDAHLWAQIYDRDLADVFAIQSEIAQTIAAQLEAKLLPTEKAEIEKPLTSNLAAYDLYNRANALAGDITYSVSKLPQINEATQLLNEAVKLDPNFFSAYIRLDYIHESLYAGWDHTPERRALADAALEAAAHLRPDDGNTHLQKAYHFYHDLDYDKARAELAEARKSLPNNSLVFAAAGFMDRRQGRWEDSIQNLQRALGLDPRNAYFYAQFSSTYLSLRRYEEMKAVRRRDLEISPGDVNAKVVIAMADFYGHGDTQAVNETIHNILLSDATEAGVLADQWLFIALARRDRSEAERALAALPANGAAFHEVTLPHPFCEALVAKLRGDETAARDGFTRTLDEAKAQLDKTPDYARSFAILGLAEAGLGRKDDAIRDGRRAVQLLPVERNSITGAGIAELLSVTYAWVGEKDLALEELSLSARTPAGVHYGELKFYTWWDSLRDDPRFDEIVASLAPKDATTK